MKVFMFIILGIFIILYKAEVALPAEYSALDRKARVQGSPDETSPCTIMAPVASKIRHECNVLQVPIQIIALEVLKRGSHPFCGIKIVMRCLLTTLRDRRLKSAALL